MLWHLTCCKDKDKRTALPWEGYILSQETTDRGLKHSEMALARGFEVLQQLICYQTLLQACQGATPVGADAKRRIKIRFKPALRLLI